MQRHSNADGQDDEMSVVSHPTWSASTSHHHQRDDPSDDGKYQHWWPAQAYHCTFCPRVFRTAQALGGHMNIHRRERAYANDAGAHYYTRRGDSHASNSLLSGSSIRPLHPVATLEQLRGPLFNGPAPTPYKENCYARRRIAVAPDSATHPVTTANFFAPIQVAGDTTCHHHAGWNGGDSATHPVTTANFFAPIQVAGDTTSRHRVGWNGGDAARSEEASGHNASDPLSWLFSQLPPPDSVSTSQRQQSQPQPQQIHQHHQQQRGGNILAQQQQNQQQQWRGGHNLAQPQRNQQHQHWRGGNVLAQPQRPLQQQQCCGGNVMMHRAVALGPSGGHPSPLPAFSAQSYHATGRLEVGGCRDGEREDGNAGGLDLELRL